MHGVASDSIVDGCMVQILTKILLPLQCYHTGRPNYDPQNRGS